MIENVFAMIVGIAIIVIGVFNRMGNVSMMHSYHTKRVSEEDRIPFGKMVGLGMIIIGISVIAASALTMASTLLQSGIYSTVGYVILAIGFVIGLGIAFYAMIKYNKGIF